MRVCLVHNMDKLYQCNHCVKRFSNNVNLHRHIRKHTGEHALYVARVFQNQVISLNTWKTIRVKGLISASIVIPHISINITFRGISNHTQGKKVLSVMTVEKGL